MPTMIQRRIRRLGAIDRRQTAVHEAGHVVIATELQIPHMGATLLCCPDSDPAEEGRWSGFTKAQLDGLPRPKKAMFGVAGRVAQACWKKHALEEIYWDDPDIMSPSDWEAVACEPGRPNDCLEEAAKQEKSDVIGVGRLTAPLLQDHLGVDEFLQRADDRSPRPIDLKRDAIDARIASSGFGV